MALIVNKMRENRLKWLGYVLRREEAKAIEISKGNTCKRKERRRMTEKEVVGCGRE